MLKNGKEFEKEPEDDYNSTVTEYLYTCVIDNEPEHYFHTHESIKHFLFETYNFDFNERLNLILQISDDRQCEFPFEFNGKPHTLTAKLYTRKYKQKPDSSSIAFPKISSTFGLSIDNLMG